MVRQFTTLCLFLYLANSLFGQAETEKLDLIMERYAEFAGNSTDYLDLYDQISTYTKRPINLNSASFEELSSFLLIGQQKALDLVNYRKQYGKFLSIYELQAIPSFSLEYIKMLLPFVSITAQGKFNLKETFKDAGNQLMILGQYNDIGYMQPKNPTDSNRILGDGVRTLVRYRFYEPGKLSIGFTAEKDAGELWPTSKNGLKAGYLSAHAFFKPQAKFLNAIAIGDYQVNFGQGLTFSSGLSFGKSALVLNTFRPTEGIRPYRSVNENQFLRGIAGQFNLTTKTKLTLFASANKDNVTVSNGMAGSLDNFGYTRTLRDISRKNNQQISILGLNINQRIGSFNVGFTSAYQHFSIPFAPKTDPYAQFRFAGNELLNTGIDYKGTFKNILFYGEVSVNDLSKKPAMTHGALISLSKRWSANFVYRDFPATYKTLYSTAWSEQSTPNNERALYAALQYEWYRKWTVSAFADIIQFPWLRFRDNAPGFQHDYFIEAKQFFNKYSIHYLRVRNTIFTNNTSEYSTIKKQQTNYRWNIRYHFENDRPGQIATAFRAEIVQLKNLEKSVLGTMFFADLGYKSKSGKIKLVGRYVIFNTPDYDSRIYAYENDVLYAFSIPAYYGIGNRFYAVLTTRLARRLTFWAKVTLENNTRKKELDQLNFSPLGRIQISYTW